MSKLDNQYRAFKELRKETKNNLELTKDRKMLMDADQKSDFFTTTKYLVHIEEDWIKEIEKGLEFVEKALAEERQFIRVDGEIVPIEKVKKVGRSSVEYLSKHANMITHLPEEGKDLTPDELYITEKNADYAVYENRFLYLLLIYLQEFVFFRLDKIDKLRSTYESEYKVNKTLNLNKRDVIIEARIYDKRLNNPYPIFDQETENRLKRMRDISSIVSAMLNTNLMSEVSKSPMIKPPITKTNVLKMNNNFKNALALYEYVSAYNTPGYSFEEVKTDFIPLTDQQKDELAEPLVLNSFLTYKIGNNIEKTLNTEYQNQERIRKEEEEKKLDDKIRRLKKKALESNQSMEEYMVLLEMRNQQLLKDSEDLSIARDEINKLNQEINKLNLDKEELYRRIDELNATIDEKNLEIARLIQKYHDDIAALKKEHEIEIRNLKEEHAVEIDNITNEYEDQIEELKANYEDELERTASDAKEKVESIENKYYDTQKSLEEKETELKEKLDNHEKEIKEITSSYETKLSELTAECNLKIDEANTASKNAIEAKDKEFKELKSALEKDCKEKIKAKDEIIDRTSQDRDLYLGELTSIKIERKEAVPGEEYASRARFTELEREYRAFERFFKEQWKLTKKQIKKDMAVEAVNLAKEAEEKKKQEKLDKAKAKEKRKDKNPSIDESSETTIEESEEQKENQEN